MAAAATPDARRLGEWKADRKDAPADHDGRAEGQRLCREPDLNGAHEPEPRNEQRVQEEAEARRGPYRVEEEIGSAAEMERMIEVVDREPAEEAQQRDQRDDGDDAGTIRRPDEHRRDQIRRAGQADGGRHGQGQQRGRIRPQLVARGLDALTLEPVDRERKGPQRHGHEDERDGAIDDAHRDRIDAHRRGAGEPLEKEPVGIGLCGIEGIAGHQRSAEGPHLAQDRPVRPADAARHEAQVREQREGGRPQKAQHQAGGAEAEAADEKKCQEEAGRALAALDQIVAADPQRTAMGGEIDRHQPAEEKGRQGQPERAGKGGVGRQGQNDGRPQRAHRDGTDQVAGVGARQEPCHATRLEMARIEAGDTDLEPVEGQRLADQDDALRDGVATELVGRQQSAEHDDRRDPGERRDQVRRGVADDGA